MASVSIIIMFKKILKRNVLILLFLSLLKQFYNVYSRLSKNNNILTFSSWSVSELMPTGCWLSNDKHTNINVESRSASALKQYRNMVEIKSLAGVDLATLNPEWLAVTESMWIIWHRFNVDYLMLIFNFFTFGFNRSFWITSNFNFNVASCFFIETSNPKLIWMLFFHLLHVRCLKILSVLFMPSIPFCCTFQELWHRP